MTSSETPGASPRPPGAGRTAPAPTGLAGHVERLARRPPPTPKGRTLAIAVLAAAVLIAALIQFLTSSGPAAHIEDLHRDDVPERPVPPEGPPGSDAAEGGAAADAGREPVPFPGTGADREVPEGISDATARRLRGAPDASGTLTLTPRAWIRLLPDLVQDASEEERAVLRPYVVRVVAEQIEGEALRREALDAGLRLAGHDARGLEPIRDAAVAHAVSDDGAAAAAFVLFSSLPDHGGASAWAAAEALVLDGDRLLGLRVLAARFLGEAGYTSAALRDLFSSPGPPEVLRRALGGGD